MENSESLRYISYVQANGCRIYIATYPSHDGPVKTESLDTKDTDWDNLSNTKLIKYHQERLYIPQKGLWIEVRYKL